MTTVHELQSALSSLYFRHFSSYSGGLGLSVPLLPRISDSYLNTRTIVLGQETNTWYRTDFEEDLKNVFLSAPDKIESVCLDNRYDDFIENHARVYGGKFWGFSRLLYDQKKIYGEMVHGNRLSHCWLNLFLVEACKCKQDENGRPTKNRRLADGIMQLQKDLLHQIFVILKPRLIVSLTGNSLDHYLLNNALKATNFISHPIDPVGILEPKHLCKIEITDHDHPLTNVTILRAYHPTYFRARINSMKKLRDKIQAVNPGMSVSTYYTNRLLDAI